MDLRQVECFVRVADDGTYAAAAASLRLAQPALWRRVKDLEDALGAALFERCGRRVRLTRDGERLLIPARALLAAADRLRVEAEDVRAGRAGVVVVACASPHLHRFLAPVIGRLAESHPGIRVDIREYGGGGTSGPGRGIPDDLLAGLADVATGPFPSDDARFASFRIYDVRLALPVAEGHPWRDRRRIDVARLRDVALVTALPGSYSRRTLEAACARAGFVPRIAFASSFPSSIVALGRAGVGVPVVVDDAIEPPTGRPWPVLAWKGRPIGGAVQLGWRAGEPLSPAVREFVARARGAAG